MKAILSLSPFIPKPFINGSVTRIYWLNKGLAVKNQLFLAYRQSPQAQSPDFSAQLIPNGYSRLRQIISPSLLVQALPLIKKRGVSLIVVNHLGSGLNGLILSVLSGVPFIFDDHNVEYIRFKRAGNLVWLLVWGLEKLVCTKSQRVLCVSEVDRQVLINSFNLSPDKVQVIENGVDMVEATSYSFNLALCRTELNVSAAEMLLLFYGNFIYPPNIEAAQLIIDEIAPRLTSLGKRGLIIFIGQGPHPVDTDIKGAFTVKKLGYVDDLIKYIKCADVMLAPLMTGSGTRFKIIETLACGTPVVTTAIGAEGIDASVCGQNLWINDDWDAFAESVVEAAQGNRSPLPTAFAEKYDWTNIVRRLEIE